MWGYVEVLGEFSIHDNDILYRKFPFLVSKIPPIPFCRDRRSRNKFRRGVKSTKFAIAGAKRKKRNFIEICHTQVEITASKFPMAAIRNSGQPQVEDGLGVGGLDGGGDKYGLATVILNSKPT